METAKETVSPPKVKHTARNKDVKNTLFFLVYVAPALILFILFKWWPMIYSFFLSFQKWNFVSAKSFVGLDNYVRLFTHQNFKQAFFNTFIYIIEMFPFFVILPLLFALLLSYVHSPKLKSIFHAMFFIPTVLAFSIVCLVWMWMYNPSFGLFNNILSMFGLEKVSWLTDMRTALPSIVVVTGWKILGSNLILYAAGLMMISKDYIEAAMLDGASQWTIFWHVKWPLLAPTTIYNIITAVNYSTDKVFIPVNVLTQGGPDNATTNLAHLIYLFGFNFFNIGLASAAAMFTSVLFLIITGILMKYSGGFGYYEN